MILPARCFSIAPSACWTHRCAPVKFVRSTASQSSSFMRSAKVSRVIAALFTRMSSRPNFASASWNPVFTCAASATSIGTTSALPPAASISATSNEIFSVLRAAAATFAPASASARAVARPIPCDAPVTKATLYFSENIRSAFRRFGARLGDFIERGLQARCVLHIQPAHRAIYLAQQARQHFARPHFHKNRHAALDHLVHRVEPADRLRHLTNQRVAGFVTGRDGFCVHIGNQREA